jgi:ABC-type sugar transport system ATPase subunit
LIEIKNLSVELRGFMLEDINFDVKDGEYFVLLGHTGAGKTVLLDSIAGLKPTNSGQIIINGRDVTSLNLEHRRIGFAYQDYTLYRHLSVRDNISFGLMWRKKDKKEIEASIDNAIEFLGLTPLLNKRSAELSGGESQKIALARAVAIKPDLLLLDEPLSAVDPETKEDYEQQLRDVHNRFELTTIHVTHNFEEAITLGDRIAVMHQGHIVQIGTPREIFRKPVTEFVARFVLTRNIFDGEVQEDSGGKSVFQSDSTQFIVTTDLQGKSHASIRPEDILISREPVQSDDLNCLKGTITRIVNRGTFVYITVEVPLKFTCLILYRTFEELNLKEKQEVFITFAPSAVNIF